MAGMTREGIKKALGGNDTIKLYKGRLIVSSGYIVVDIPANGLVFGIPFGSIDRIENAHNLKAIKITEKDGRSVLLWLPRQ